MSAIHQNVLTFKSVSGEEYLIPAHQYDEEIRTYRNAANSGDEETLMMFEAGMTGWKCVGATCLPHTPLRLASSRFRSSSQA